MNEQKVTVTVTPMKAEHLLNMQNEIICDFNNVIAEMYERLSEENKKIYEDRMESFKEMTQKATNKHFIVF